MRLLSSLVLIALSLGSAKASEEEYLQWRAIKIDCFESSQTGKVRISAHVSARGIADFSITAFGREYVLQEDGLNQIRAYPLSSLRTSHEAGYRRLGGHTVYAKMRRLIRDKGGDVLTEEAIISVSKKRGISVTARTIE